MEYSKNDSSGTDDDLPNHSLIRTSRGVFFSGAMRILSGSMPRATDFTDMEFQIHCIETEAYGAVLRAFIAQSDVLSWGKEELITELRKELRVSDVEHREILGKINLDNSIKSIREWRKGIDSQQLTTMHPPSEPISGGHMSRKRLKPAHLSVSSSPRYPPRAQPSPGAVPSSLITHVRDEQRSSNAAALSPGTNIGQTMIPVPQNMQAPSSGKLRGSQTLQASNKGLVYPGYGNVNPESDIIEIRATDKVLREVEKVCCGVNVDPAQVERAKLILREHERALMEAIGKLANVSDDDDSPDLRHPQYSNEERRRNAQGFHNVACEHRSYYNEGFINVHAERGGIPCVDLQDDVYD